MQRDNRIAAVVGSAQNLRQFGLGHPLSNLGHLCRRFAERFVALFVLGDVEKETSLFESRSISFPGVDDVFEGGLLFENGLSFFAVVPEIRLGGDLVQLLNPRLFSIEVKDASAEVRVVLLDALVVLGFLPTSF